VLDQGVLYLAGTGVSAIHTSDGKTLWHTALGSGLGASTSQVPASVGTGTGTVDAVVDGVVYGTAYLTGSDFPSPTAIYALDARSGKLLWQVKQSGGGHIAKVSGGIVYVAYAPMPPTGTEGLTALSAKDGVQLWHFDTPGSVIVPQAMNGQVYAIVRSPATTDGAPRPAYLVALDARTGAVQWRFPRDASGTTYLLNVIGNQAYVASNDGNENNSPNIVYALSASDGSVIWRAPTQEDALYGYVLESGTLYLSWFNGAVLALDATTGARKWRVQPGGPGQPEGAYVAFAANGAVYLSLGEQGFYALSASDGSLKWHVPTTGALFLLAQRSGIVYASSLGENDTLFALNASSGAVLWRYDGNNLEVDSAVVG
jgi:outer membrane protein assembly factor BamB